MPPEVWPLTDHQTDLPRIARDPKLTSAIAARLREIPSTHDLYRHDALDLAFVSNESVHLVVTSPPYWTLKEYRKSDGQLGHVEKYDDFLAELDKVWRHCLRVLVPGGRLIVVSTILPPSSGTRSPTQPTKLTAEAAASSASHMSQTR